MSPNGIPQHAKAAAHVFRHPPIIIAPGDQVVESILREIMVDPTVLEEAKRRRAVICRLGMQHPAARAFWFSGSIAHGTENAPLGDADCGLMIDRRSEAFRAFGPDVGAAGKGPEEFIHSFATFIEPLLTAAGYPHARVDLSGNRAIKFAFNAPIEFDELGIVDQYVDLIIGLDRRDATGVWITNRRRNSWDPAHPQRHTELMTETGSPALIVHRAHVIRLEKRAVKRDAFPQSTPVVCSWNLSALALEHVAERQAIAQALAESLRAASVSIRRELTGDPAGVAGKIQLPDGMTQLTASQRLGEMAELVAEAATATSTNEARRLLSPLFGVEIDNIRAKERLAVSRAPLNSALRGGNRAAVGAALGTATPPKRTRSDGD